MQDKVHQTDSNGDNLSTMIQKDMLTSNHSWVKNMVKKKRMLGQEYIGYSINEDGKIKHDVQREERKLGEVCGSNFCKKANNRFCDTLLEADRKEIFSKFWKMDWELKRLFIINMTSYEKTKRAYTNCPSSRRNGTFQYFLKMSSGRYQVCKKTFLNTLGLKEKMVYHWASKSKNFGLLDSAESRNFHRSEKRKTSTYAQQQNQQKDYVNQFLDDLPKMESHYCRKDSSKLYLQHDFQSKSELYSLYKTRCLDNSQAAVSMSKFTEIFQKQNLALFKPRKDQCDVCYSFKMNQVNQDIYDNHIANKNSAQKEKNRDKKNAEENNIYCFTIDVQGVKLCPVLQANALYYKSKLQIHNFTIYNIATHDSTNYLWNEAEADLRSSIFTTIIIKHLEKLLTIAPKPVVIFSDGCGYQNRNSVLSNALSRLSSKYDIIIEQKYLEKGHTQMECDSTHSLIERRLKRRDILLPTDYIQIVKDARRNPKPLDVEYLDYKYFLNYDDAKLARYVSIRPHKSKVVDIRCFKYIPDGKIMYKIRYSDEYKNLPQKPIDVDPKYSPKFLFDQRLKISQNKWMQLQTLKKVLPTDTHFFYDNLPVHGADSATKKKSSTKVLQPVNEESGKRDVGLKRKANIQIVPEIKNTKSRRVGEVKENKIIKKKWKKAKNNEKKNISGNNKKITS